MAKRRNRKQQPKAGIAEFDRPATSGGIVDLPNAVQSAPQDDSVALEGSIPSLDFDLGFALEQTPQIADPLVQITNTIADFEQQIHNQMHGCVARGRTTASSLNACLTAAIAQQQQILTGRVMQLQQSIESGIAGRFGTAMEFAAQAGVDLSPVLASTAQESTTQQTTLQGSGYGDWRDCLPHVENGIVCDWTYGFQSAHCWRQSDNSEVPLTDYAIECLHKRWLALQAPGGGGIGGVVPGGDGGTVQTPPGAIPPGTFTPPPGSSVSQPPISIGGIPPGTIIGGPPGGIIQPPLGSMPPPNWQGSPGLLWNWIDNGRPGEWCPSIPGTDATNYVLLPQNFQVVATDERGILIRGSERNYTTSDFTDMPAAIAAGLAPGGHCQTNRPPTNCPVCQQQACCCTPPPVQLPKETKYTAWEGKASGVCYVLKSDEPPRDPIDRPLRSGVGLQEAQQAATSGCPPKEENGEGGNIAIPPINWPGSAWCNPEFLYQLGSPGQGGRAVDWWVLSSVLGLRDGLGNATGPKRPLITLSIAEAVKQLSTDGLRWLSDLAGRLIQDTANSAACIGGEKIAIDVSRILFTMLSKYTSDVFEEFQQPLAYKSHWLCPQLLPDLGGINQAYLGNQITEDQWRGWTAAQNACPEPARRVLMAQRSKPVPLQLSMMHRRGFISRSEMDSGYRELGYLDPTVVGQLHDLTQQLPPPSDIIRMMVRDADDNTIAQTFGTDAQFQQKFGSTLQYWSEAQGMDPQVMQYLWRAHWTIPAPGQLYEMYHRLSRLPVNDPRYVSLQDITTALVQQDILPYWIPKLLATSFRVITRTDAQKAYQIGSVTSQQLIAIYQDLGYDLPDATTLQQTEDTVRYIRWLNNRWSKLYERGAITLQQFTTALTSIGASQQDVTNLASELDNRRGAATRLKCINAERSNHLKGLTTAAQLNQNLINLGLDPIQAQQIAGGIVCERSAKGRAFTARQLCKYLEQGLVTAQYFTTIMLEIGYDATEAAIIVQSCTQGITTKQLAQAQRFAKQQAAQAKAAQREADQTARQQQAAANRSLRQAAAVQRAMEKREAALAAQSEKLSKKAGLPLPDAFVEIKTAYNRLRSGGAMSVIEAITAIRVGIQSLPNSGATSWQSAIDDAAVGGELLEAEGLL